VLEQGIAYARRVGDRREEWNLLSELSWSLALTGRWPEAFNLLGQVPEERLVELILTFLLALTEPLVAEGRLEKARHLLSLYARHKDSSDQQAQVSYRAAEAVLLHAEGNESEALASAQTVLDALLEIGPASQAVKVAFPQALEAALALGDREQAKEMLAKIEALPPGRLAPSLRGHAARFRGRLAGLEGDPRTADNGFATAGSIFREHGMVFWLAITLTELAEWLIAAEHAAEAEPLLAEARETFERLGATPWLARIETAQAQPRAEANV
jgi:tetratricopeptide (TPR) repeat protein